MPNPGKPHALKLLTGSRRASHSAPAVAFPALQDVPSPPDWILNAHAVKEWDRLAPILTECGLLTDASLAVLGHACNLHGAIVRTLSAGGQPKPALLAQYRLLINDFGLTPAFQAKVVAGSPTTPNRFHRSRPPC